MALVELNSTQKLVELPAIPLDRDMPNRREARTTANTIGHPLRFRPMAAPTPPGWYPDPSGTGQQRYWDGQVWLQLPPPPPGTPVGQPAERRFTIHYGFALLAIFSLLGTLVFGLPLMAQAGDEDTGGVASTMGVLWLLWGGMWTVIWTAFAIQHTLRGRR